MRRPRRGTIAPPTSTCRPTVSSTVRRAGSTSIGGCSSLLRAPYVPLLERTRFLAIFATNLDEFFMVRVAGLKRRIATGIAVTAPSGLSARDQLELVSEQAHSLVTEHASAFFDNVRPELADRGIHLLRWRDLDADDHASLRTFFSESVYPVLTPLAVDPAHPFPYISGLSLNLAVVVRDPTNGEERFARVKVPQILSRFMPLGRGRFVTIEEIIAAHLHVMFPGMEVLESHTFRVTRNEDLEVDEDDVDNLLQALERELLRRRFGPPVRLEVEETMSDRVLDLLIRELGVNESEVYRLPAPLDLVGLWSIADLERPELKYEQFVPATHPKLVTADGDGVRDIFAALRTGDILVHHPYDSFATSVQAFVEQAAADDNVLAIKQTLYRTSGDSPIVDALVDAARAGKQVLVLVEIKARFDEEANIRWARKLEQAGCHVVYGLVGLKTHCKLCLVVRREPDGSLRRYAHLGTGNYNPKTARIYEDVGLLTADPAVGADVADLFNHLSGYTRPDPYRTLLVAPDTVRSGLARAIRREAENALAGRPSGITMKLNSLVDEELIDDLLRSVAGGCTRRSGGARHVCASSWGQRAVGEHPGAQRPRPVPRALAHLAVQGGRRRRVLDRQCRSHASQSRQAGRDHGAGQRSRGQADSGGRPRRGDVRRDRVLAVAPRRHVRLREGQGPASRVDQVASACPGVRATRTGTRRTTGHPLMPCFGRVA